MELCYCRGIKVQLRAILYFLLYSQNYNSPSLKVLFLGNVFYFVAFYKTFELCLVFIYFYC